MWWKGDQKVSRVNQISCRPKGSGNYNSAEPQFNHFEGAPFFKLLTQDDSQRNTRFVQHCVPLITAFCIWEWTLDFCFSRVTWTLSSQTKRADLINLITGLLFAISSSLSQPQEHFMLSLSSYLYLHMLCQCSWRIFTISCPPPGTEKKKHGACLSSALFLYLEESWSLVHRCAICRLPVLFTITLKYLQWCQLSSQLGQQASCMTNFSQCAIELLDRADPWKVQEPLVKV